jgi:hypothetical protein
MNEKILERLLVDRALGGLSSDVAALLDAHLENKPAPAGLRNEIDEAVQLAARALPHPPSRPLPPPKFIAFPQTIAAKPLYRRLRWPAELAAVFVLGLGLGLWTPLRNEPLASRPDRIQVVAMRESPRAESQSAAFWSVARLVCRESRPSSPPAPRLSWRSLAHTPQPTD